MKHGSGFEPLSVSLVEQRGLKYVGLVVEPNDGQLDVVQDAGDEAAHARDGQMVAIL